jgi:ribosomal protein L11 methyltransferase
MRDYILQLDSIDEQIEARLYLTASSGWTIGDVVEAYFDSAGERDAAATELADLNPRPIDRERVDWLQHYQQSLTAMEIGERFVVAPDASLIHDADRLAIVVPQEQAFGTGSHETTALCIETLEQIAVSGHRGLDVGSGSGILAIAMLRLGASKAIAFDNDPDAFGALRDNRIRNGIDERAMPLFIGSVEALRKNTSGGTFDVITMNIIPEVILPLLGDVVTHMAAGARLVLSGILTIKRDEVVAAAKTHGLELISEKAKGEWWAGTFAMSDTAR